MKWQVDEIMKMETVKMNLSPESEQYISRDAVIELLSRKCKDCKHFETRIEQHPFKNKTRKCSYCIHPEVIRTAHLKRAQRYEGGRMAGSSDNACKRFER